MKAGARTRLAAFAVCVLSVACEKPSSSPSKGDHSAAAATPPPPPPPPPPAEVLAWVLPYENSLASLQRNAPFVTIVSPTYFRLAVDDGATSKKKSVKLESWDPAAPFPRARLAPLLGEHKPSIIPLVGCIGPCGPKISRVLDDEASRKAHVDDLLRTVREESLEGLVIDYEDVNASEASVSSFVEELSKSLHAMAKKLVLVVQEPCGSDPSCKRSPYPFALKHLVTLVDQLAVMEYDYVVDGSAPPAPRAWVDRGLRRVLSEVGVGHDRYKIICAVPFYGRVTKGIADDTAVLYDEVKPTAIRTSKVTVGPLALDAAAFSKVATVTGAKGKSGTLYLEDHDTIAARIEHVTSLGLGGIAIWRLGGEDPCISVELAKLRKLAPPACP